MANCWFSALVDFAVIVYQAEQTKTSRWWLAVDDEKRLGFRGKMAACQAASAPSFPPPFPPPPPPLAAAAIEAAAPLHICRHVSAAQSLWPGRGGFPNSSAWLFH